MVCVQWVADETAVGLLDDALKAFDAAAIDRIEDLACSPLVEPGSDDGSSQQGGQDVRSARFSFALRSISAVAPYAGDGVAAELMRWHDRERVRAGGAVGAEHERAMRECAVDCVFCEAMLATLSASRCRDSILLDSLQECALDFFRLPSTARQQAARRRLIALRGRSEEMLWTDLVRALCRHRFESFTHKVLIHLENTGSDRRGRAVAPDFGALAMCSSLQGVQLPECGGAGSNGGTSATLSFFERLARMLLSKSMKGLHRPVSEALGSALLEQCLSDPQSLTQGAFSGGARADATSATLQKLQLQLASWATARVGMPRKLTAKFGSWAAPLATSLVCMAGGHDVPGEAALELHNRLLRRLLRCIKQPETTHRVMALRCLRLQLPYLMAVKGGSRDGLAPIDQLFTGRVSGMHLELPREKDVPLLLRRYGELLDGHTSLALAIGKVDLKVMIERIVLRGLRGEGGSSSQRWGHPGVLALSTLERILVDRPVALDGLHSPCGKSVKTDVTECVAGMVVGCAASKHLVEGAPVGAHWLLSLQLLNGALRCLRLLWASSSCADHEHCGTIPLEKLLPLLSAQLCGTQPLLQTAASALLQHLVANGATEVLPSALSALTDAILNVGAASRTRKRVALQQISPLIARWLDAPCIAHSLLKGVHRMEALAFLLLAEPCPKLRGEAAGIMCLLSPVSKAIQPGAVLDSQPVSVADALKTALPAIVERALSDPLQLDLWCGFGASAAAKSAVNGLRSAAAHGDLRACVEALGSSDGEAELWLCCLHGCAHAVARAGGSCELTIRAAWPMLIARCPRVSPSSAVPASWAPYASLASACAIVVFSNDSGDSWRADVERLLRDSVRLLVCDNEAHRIAAAAVLGQLRGAAAVQLVLSELAPALHQAAGESDWARHATKNGTSRVHIAMRQLAHVLSLLSAQDDWPVILVTCGAPLAALARWLHGALEYLGLPWNRNVWSLQRTRKYTFDVLSRTTPQLLSALAAHANAAQTVGGPLAAVGLRPSAVLLRVADLLEALSSESASQAIDAERTRLMHGQRASATDLGRIEAIIGEELAYQEQAVQVSALEAIAALATPEAVGGLQARNELPLTCVEALVLSSSEAVAGAARRALCALWAACSDPLPSMVQKCYSSAQLAIANAHFIALVTVALNLHPGAHISNDASWSGDPSSTESYGHVVPLLVLALTKLSDGSAEVRSMAERLLHAYGGSASSLSHPELIAQGLPWCASHAQLCLSERLATTHVALAPAVVTEVMKRAREASLPLAQLLMSFVIPWARCAALSLLPPIAASIRASERASSTVVGLVVPESTDAIDLLHVLLESLIFHSQQAHSPLAQSLHELWRAIAADDVCVKPIIHFLLFQVQSRGLPIDESNDDGIPDMVTDAVAVATSLEGHSTASVDHKRTVQEEVTMRGGDHATVASNSWHDTIRKAGSASVLRACQTAILAVSSAQPASCAHLLAARLALPGYSTRAAGEDGSWPRTVDPHAIEEASAAMQQSHAPGRALAHAALHTFSAPLAAALHSFRTDSFPRGNVSHATPEEAVTAASAWDVKPSLCTLAEAALLLLAATVDDTISVLVSGSQELLPHGPARECQARAFHQPPPPPPHHPPPPKHGELLAYVLHTSVLIRMHGRHTLPSHSGRLLARLISVAGRSATPSDDADNVEVMNWLLQSRSERVHAQRRSASSFLGDARPFSEGRGASWEPSPSIAECESLATHAVDQLRLIVRGLQRSLCTHGFAAVGESWAACALRHGCFPQAISKAGDGERALDQQCSLLTYSAMVGDLRPDVLSSHARVLLDAACTCALHPRAETVTLAAEASNALTAILSVEGEASNDPKMLADIVWRCAMLLHSDCVPLYNLGVSTLSEAIKRRSLSDCALSDALVTASPPFWRGHGQTLDFCGLQPLLLKGLGCSATRQACLVVMRHAASCGPQPNGILEHESTRLLTCTVALVPWLSEQAKLRQDEQALPFTSYSGAADRSASSSAQAGGAVQPELAVARELANACVESAKDSTTRPGRRELLPIATVLNNYAMSQYDLVSSFLRSMREALRTALSPHPPSVVYTHICTLLCSLGEGRRSWPDVLSMTHWLVEQVQQKGEVKEHVNPCILHPPVQHLWRSVIEVAMEAPTSAQPLAACVEALLSACTSGLLQPQLIEASRASLTARMSGYRQPMRSVGGGASAEENAEGPCTVSTGGMHRYPPSPNVQRVSDDRKASSPYEENNTRESDKGSRMARAMRWVGGSARKLARGKTEGSDEDSWNEADDSDEENDASSTVRSTPGKHFSMLDTPSRSRKLVFKRASEQDSDSGGSIDSEDGASPRTPPAAGSVTTAMTPAKPVTTSFTPAMASRSAPRTPRSPNSPPGISMRRINLDDSDESEDDEAGLPSVREEDEPDEHGFESNVGFDVVPEQEEHRSGGDEEADDLLALNPALLSGVVSEGRRRSATRRRRLTAKMGTEPNEDLRRSVRRLSGGLVGLRA